MQLALRVSDLPATLPVTACLILAQPEGLCHRFAPVGGACEQGRPAIGSWRDPSLYRSLARVVDSERALALALGRCVSVSLFAVAGTALLLLLTGIHNAWDTVTYIALDHIQAPSEPDEPG